MISVKEASEIILSHTRDFGVEEIDLMHSSGKVLRDEIFAERDMPPFDRVAMDGIAILYEAFNEQVRTFTIEGMAAAGDAQHKLSNPHHCLEIMTGAILPFDTDTVIPYEWISIDHGVAVIKKNNVIRGQNVHLKGTDRKEGDMLIPSGRMISAGEIGVLASVGKGKVKVSRSPKTLIVSTGNELVTVENVPLPHQVRMSNVYQLHAALKHLNIESDTIHLQDDYSVIVKETSRCIEEYDVIIISGGISAGKFDHIPTVLEELGVKKHFYKVQQKPGKPFWFGTHANSCTVFGIPGNPVSSFLCYIRYIRPWLEGCLQLATKPNFSARLSEDVTFKADLTYFLNIRLQQDENAEWIAVPSKGHGSGDLSNLADTDAFIELPVGKEFFHKGEIFPIYKFRS